MYPVKLTAEFLKLAKSGLEQPLLWLVIDPLMVALLAWKGLKPTDT